MSPAKVYQLTGNSEVLYLKMTDCRYAGTTYDVEREKDMLLWLQDKLPVPRVLHFERHEGWHTLLMSQAPGVICTHNSQIKRKPELMVEILAQCVERFQAIDLSNCPYNNCVNYRLNELDYLLNNSLADVDPRHWEDDTLFSDPSQLHQFLKDNIPEEELVFSHGDLGDSNILVRQGEISGFIDLGRSGMADKWYDIAFCVRDIREFGERHLLRFFDLLGQEPDWRKIKYYILLDELF